MMLLMEDENLVLPQTKHLTLVVGMVDLRIASESNNEPMSSKAKDTRFNMAEEDLNVP